MLVIADGEGCRRDRQVGWSAFRAGVPAEATTKIPAACVLLTIVSSSAFVVQPSLTGHVQLLLMT
jgi:hypothetical protein